MRNKLLLLLVSVLHKTQNQAFSRYGCAKTGMKYTKKCDAHPKLLFCLLNLLCFLMFSLLSALLDLKVPIFHLGHHRQNTRKTVNNAVKMSLVFQDIARFERFTDLNVLTLLEYLTVQCHSKLGNGCFTILFDGACFLLAVMVEGDESSQLRIAIN